MSVHADARDILKVKENYDGYQLLVILYRIHQLYKDRVTVLCCVIMSLTYSPFHQALVTARMVMYG